MSVIHILQEILRSNDIQEIHELAKKAIGVCKDCEEAQRDYELTLIEAGRDACGELEEEVRYWQTKYYSER